MPIDSSILIASLLFTGLAIAFPNVGYRLETRHQSYSFQQQLLAQTPDASCGRSDPPRCRQSDPPGSGRRE